MFQLCRMCGLSGTCILVVRKAIQKLGGQYKYTAKPNDFITSKFNMCLYKRKQPPSHMSAHQRKSHKWMWSNITPYTLTTVWAHFQNLINCHRLSKSLSYHFRSRNDWVTGTRSGIRQDFEWIRCNVELWTSHQFGAWDEFIMVAFPSYLRHAGSEDLVPRDWRTIC